MERIPTYFGQCQEQCSRAGRLFGRLATAECDAHAPGAEDKTSADSLHFIGEIRCSTWAHCSWQRLHLKQGLQFRK